MKEKDEFEKWLIEIDAEEDGTISKVLSEVFVKKYRELKPTLKSKILADFKEKLLSEEKIKQIAKHMKIYGLWEVKDNTQGITAESIIWDALNEAIKKAYEEGKG